MSSRTHISLKTKLAAALALIFEIPHAHQQAMTAEQVLSLAAFDHWPVCREDGLLLGMSVEQVDHFSNLWPRMIWEHREKTAKIDLPQMAKSKRIRAKRAAVAAAPAAKPRHSRWPQGRKIQSQPFANRRKR